MPPLQDNEAIIEGEEEEAEEPTGTERTALIFNLGGGTCDVSLVVLDAGVLEARAGIPVWLPVCQVVLLRA